MLEKHQSLDGINDQALPIPIQIFLWRQISPFIRPKLGKLHEASCMFCQHAPGHHELKEACKSFEKVLVQNIQFGLSPSLSEAIKSIPRWRLVQAALPHVMHCTATTLHNRMKDGNLQSLGAVETKLLYTLHWIILDAAEECADADYEKGEFHSSPFYYLFSIPSITLFVYLFAPLCHQLKESDFQNFRLENGLKMWQALWEFRHPETSCFTAQCRPKPKLLSNNKLSKGQNQFCDLFLGRKQSTDDGLLNANESPPSQKASTSLTEHSSSSSNTVIISTTKTNDDDGNWVSSPKDTIFPETIPEESSSAEEEHVVIFRLPSLHESDSFLRDPSIYTADTNLFQLALAKNVTTVRANLKVDQSTNLADLKPSKIKQKIEKMGSSTDKESFDGGGSKDKTSDKDKDEKGSGHQTVDLSAATFLDVAVLRCLFITHWQEEGVYWALHFLYNRLREISEEFSTQAQPRRRSNSLPIPKIEVSIYQSPESKRKEEKDFMEVPELKDVSLLAESPYHNVKRTDENTSPHQRRASEKSKKKMKMADLKAFVETKLLSKSEKALEKIGQDEPKQLFEQAEYHRSLDTGDEHLSRPNSTLSRMFEPIKDPFGTTSNLVKGKSMPSLSCLIDELTAGGYIGEIHWDRRRTSRATTSQSTGGQNPIITVTEHTPTPSPDYMKRQGSIDSQLDALSMSAVKLNTGNERKASLTRSQTDSNITYLGEEIPEAPGSVAYITKDGDIDYQVVLKAVHSAAMHDNACCSLRVIEVILNLVEILMDMGVLKQCLRDEAVAQNTSNQTSSNLPTSGKNNQKSSQTLSQSGNKDDISLAGGSISGVGLTGSTCKGAGASMSEKEPSIKDEKIDKTITPFTLIMSVLFRVLRHLGCPHGCADGQRGPPAEFLRTQCQNILSKLHRASQKQFSKFLKNIVLYYPILEILDFFHAYVGFCVDPSSLLSPLTDQKRSCSKSPDINSQSGYATNFGAGLGGHGSRGVEGQVISYVFKSMVTRFVKFSKELKMQDNMALYCDIRQLMTYVKEAHGGVFRRVILSALIDTANKSNKKQNIQTTRVIRHIRHSDIQEFQESNSGDTCYMMDERGFRKQLFKKRSTSSTCASLLDTEINEEPSKSQSPIGNLRKKHHILTPRQSERALGIIEQPSGSKSISRGSTKTRFSVSWFRRDTGASESTDSIDNGESPTESTGFIRQPSLFYPGGKLPQKSTTNMGETIQKAKRRMEDKLNKFGIKKGKKKDKSMDEAPGSYFSRRNSMDFGDASRESEFVVLKERKLVPTQALLDGMLRFSFLLESCQPGTVPDPPLMGAILDLPHSAVVARAAFYMECAYFVHCCNRNQWPNWMKLTLPMFRQSGPVSGSGLGVQRGPPQNAPRRTHAMQRTAGKLFYQWAEVIAARLEELLIQDKQHEAHINSLVSDEQNQKELLIQDEEEDFLDEASINLHGTDCPMALRLIACNLLLEITAFLRETYQTLPKSSRLSTRGERPPPWERMYSRDANRRWSMALSSMGHSQTSAQSLQSIAGDRDAGQPERKISFVLHEPDNESEGSSNTTVTMQGEELQQQEKEKSRRPPAPTRPYLLRRGTGGPGTTGGGSFKRRSLKLRRGTKEGKDVEYDFAVKRADSIQSKRKVSSLSDRSDTSEPGLILPPGCEGLRHLTGGGESGGEESPGVLSDEQPPESPSDSNDTDDTSKNLPWIKVIIQIANSFNYSCPHQLYCHPNCYRRNMRASTRLMKAVRKVYGEEFGIIDNDNNPILQMENTEKIREEKEKKDKTARSGRKVSEQTSQQASPIKRKDSMGRRDRIDRNIDSSQAARFISNRDSSRDITDQDVEKGKNDPKKKKEELKKEEKPKQEPPILKYIKTQVHDAFHTPIALLVKGAVILTEENFVEVMGVAWHLLLEWNQEVAASAASLFILGAVRAPQQVTEIMNLGLQHQEPSVRINSILRFQVLWKLRYQVWQRMEEGAQLTFKVPPPGIEFTLPSPKIGIESLPVVDPPWMPQVKTKVEEVTINQERHRSLVTATKTRKKQQTELIKMALQAQDDKKREERENFLITTIPITVQAAYEPSLYHAAGDDHEEAAADNEEAADGTGSRTASHHLHSAHSLFPSSLCAAVVEIINLLDDAAVSPEGSAVYEVAYKVIWSCLVEDSALCLRYVLERLTRDKQDQMFKILRHLIRFIPKLPQQAAFALYNYIIGYIMFYTRTPHEDGQKLIGTALSVLWMVVHSVHGIMFKDLKQILRKEQCDASILLTANVPSAKKIIVHGPQEPDAGGIPSQFPVQEDTQFCQILRESLDFFGIEESRHKEFFLVDYKTHQIHNPHSYVRDYYFFKRSQYPQLELIHMRPEDAFNALQQQELVHKFVEIGKTHLTWAILKNVDMVVQRVVFLHEELMKLPSFPRKALESDLDLYKGGEIGKELLGLDVLHKFMWVRLIARMFEAMAGNFAYSNDIHLFLNVLNGAVILHSEDCCILRYVMATYINAAHHFKNIFSTNGYLLIMPTLLQMYSNHQTNKLVTTTVEYAVKQFYLMNRKPFILQMFGSVSAILDTDENSTFGDAHKVQSSCLFNLLLSLETPSPDPLNIGELVKEDKPLKAIDFCYHDENEMVGVMDCISLCVMVVSYSAESLRGYQMLIILEAILPCYIKHIQGQVNDKESREKELEKLQILAVALKTLVNNCEALTKSYNGPYRSSPEHKGSSQRNYSRGGPYSPGFDFEEETHSKYLSEHGRAKSMYDHDAEDSEVLRAEYRRPRDVLLSLVGDFMHRANNRLALIKNQEEKEYDDEREKEKERGKEKDRERDKDKDREKEREKEREREREREKERPDFKPIHFLDIKTHIKLAEIAHSILKVSPYDPESMSCRGLQHYMNYVLPAAEWTNDQMRPSLVTILRRLDKVFQKIAKKASVRRNTDWEAAGGLLKGVHEAMLKHPSIMHWQQMKALINTCQSFIMCDVNLNDTVPSATAALMNQAPPSSFCAIVVRLIVQQMLDTEDHFSLEQICGGNSVFPNQDRTETFILNLIMPLCLRVGSGRDDIPKMHPPDISFALQIILHALCPPISGTKQPIATQSMKTTTDVRTGSLTFTTNRDTKISTRINKSLYTVAFLALKMMVICFEEELRFDWMKVTFAMRSLGRRNEAANSLWDFMEFVVTYRTPLFILCRPFIWQKVSAPPISDHERYMQSVIKGKLNCTGMPHPKSKGCLLMELAREMKELKEELEDSKYDPEPNKKDSSGGHQISTVTIANETMSVGGTHRNQRPSLIEMLTGGTELSALVGVRTSVGSGGTTSGSGSATSATLAPNTLPNTLGPQMTSSSGTRTPSDTASSQNLGKRESLSSASFSSTPIPGHTANISESLPDNSNGGVTPTNPPTDRSLQSSASEDHFVPSSQVPKTSKLRFVSSVEFKHSSGETSTTPLSPGSPADESSGEGGSRVPQKLQRVKPQSRKTFRLRKSRKNKIEVSHIKIESDSLPSTPVATTPPHHVQPLPQTPVVSAAPASLPVSELSVSAANTIALGHLSDSSIRSRRLSSRASKNNETTSWDSESVVSQTSSTSGYRESISLQLTTMGSPCNIPPLASPDLHDLPSTSSATTTNNYMVFDGSSPDCSFSGNGNERTALLSKNERNLSQQSLLMVFETRDEDTLI